MIAPETHLIRSASTRTGRGCQVRKFFACGRSAFGAAKEGLRPNQKRKLRALILSTGTYDLANVTCAECRRRATLPRKSRYVEPEPKPPVPPPVLTFEEWDEDTPIGGKP